MISNAAFAECSICTESFDSNAKTPLILNLCGHTFCKECIELLVTTVSGYSQFSCPTCKQLYRTYGDRNALTKTFPKNFQVLSFVDQKVVSYTCQAHKEHAQFMCLRKACPNKGLACYVCLTSSHGACVNDSLLDFSKFSSVRYDQDLMWTAFQSLDPSFDQLQQTNQKLAETISVVTNQVRNIAAHCSRLDFAPRSARTMVEQAEWFSIASISKDDIAITSGFVKTLRDKIFAALSGFIESVQATQANILSEFEALRQSLVTKVQTDLFNEVDSVFNFGQLMQDYQKISTNDTQLKELLLVNCEEFWTGGLRKSLLDLLLMLKTTRELIRARTDKRDLADVGS